MRGRCPRPLDEQDVPGGDLGPKRRRLRKAVSPARADARPAPGAAGVGAVADLSQSRAHLRRQVNGRPHAAQIFCGRSASWLIAARPTRPVTRPVRGSSTTTRSGPPPCSSTASRSPRRRQRGDAAAGGLVQQPCWPAAGAATCGGDGDAEVDHPRHDQDAHDDHRRHQCPHRLRSRWHRSGYVVRMTNRQTARWTSSPGRRTPGCGSTGSWPTRIGTLSRSRVKALIEDGAVPGAAAVARPGRAPCSRAGLRAPAAARRSPRAAAAGDPVRHPVRGRGPARAGQAGRPGRASGAGQRGRHAGQRAAGPLRRQRCRASAARSGRASCTGSTRTRRASWSSPRPNWRWRPVRRVRAARPRAVLPRAVLGPAAPPAGEIEGAIGRDPRDRKRMAVVAAAARRR